MSRTTVRATLRTAAVTLALAAGTLVAAPVQAEPAPSTADLSTPAARSSGDDVGRWRVQQVGRTTYRVSWTSPTRLPVTDARPEIHQSGRPLGPAQVSADGRTVTVTVRSADEPRRADLDAVLSGQSLDEPAPPAPAPSTPYAVPQVRRTLGVDPGDPGQHPVVSEDYRLAPVKLAGMPAAVEMVGHVVRASDATPDTPLVLFLHGRHSPCYGDPIGRWRDWPCPRGMTPVPSHLGYDYLQQLLARQGYVTVSVAANGINAQDWRLGDGGAQARATLVRRHLQAWADWVADGRYVADLDNVVLVGHSRGGEGVNRASLEIPLGADYRVTGQVLIAPTNFGRASAGYVPTVVLLPYCDGDVIDLQGQSFTEVARDLRGDDTALRSSVLVMGANHNFFNTEWTPGISAAPSFDDWSGDPDQTCGRRTDERLSPLQQRQAAKPYVAGAVQLFTGGDAGLLPLFDGTRVTAESAGTADVLTHAVGNGRVLRTPGSEGVSLSAPDGATTRFCSGRTGRRAGMCGFRVAGERAPHWPSPWLPAGVPTHPAFEMSWTEAGQRGGLTFSRPLDLSNATYVDLRTAVDPALGNVHLAAVLHDSAGSSLRIDPAGGTLPALPNGGYALGKLWGQTLRIPVSSITGIDLADVTGIDLVSREGDGHIFVFDVAVADRSLAPVAQTRVPRVDLGTATVTEGDGSRQRFVDVPFRVRRPDPEGGRFVVTGMDEGTWTAITPIPVALAPGQSSGVVRVPYQPDRSDDFDVQRVTLWAFAKVGVMPDDYIGQARIKDDDPLPRVRLSKAANKVTEGESATYRVSLVPQPGYYAGLTGRVVRGDVDTPRVRVSDVTKRWRERFIWPPVKDLETPLHRAGATMWGSLYPDKDSARLRVDFRRDGRDEPREAVTVRARVTGPNGVIGWSPARTVYVVDPNG